MDRRIRPPRLLGAALLALLPALAACSDGASPTGPVPGLPPTVLGVQPGVVDAGGSATIRGLNFAEQPSANEVTFGDLTASVGSASETSLSISLPSPTELPC
ncbi:MAG: IPT/TIG domain-containing protein, partial [Gemmatimonadota bacterium]